MVFNTYLTEQLMWSRPPVLVKRWLLQATCKEVSLPRSSLYVHVLNWSVSMLKCAKSAFRYSVFHENTARSPLLGNKERAFVSWNTLYLCLSCLTEPLFCCELICCQLLFRSLVIYCGSYSRGITVAGIVGWKLLIRTIGKCEM